MPNQRTAGADQGSAFPHRPSVPWWGAVLIAVAATLTGFAIEAASGHRELGTVFAVCYGLGCVAAVLAVRQSGIFTAIIQPPLLLFVAVPLAYFLLHGSAFNGVKDIAISCGYPLVERFPLMLFVSAAVLLIGMVRWYLAMSAPTRPQGAEAAVTAERPSLLANLTAKLSSAFAGNGAETLRTGRESVDPPARARHGVNRPAAQRRPRPARRAGEREPVRSRRSGPRRDDRRADIGDSPPRPRRDPARRAARDADRAMDPPRRRPREPREPRDPRRTPPPRRDAWERRDYADYREHRDGYPTRSGRSGGYEPPMSGSPDHGYRTRPAHDPYPPQGPRRRPAPGSRDSNRHPVSRVRYRDSGPDVDFPEDRRDRPVR